VNRKETLAEERLGSEMHWLNVTNPFTTRGMLRDPQQFFGRRAELERLLDRVRTMQSVSIVGERCIGKSSLLYRLSQSNDPLRQPTHVVYTPLADVKDEASFYACLLRELGNQGNGFADLERIVNQSRVVFCLDEFETVVAGQSFPVSFFNSLRALAQTGNFALIVATEHSLADLCRDRKIQTSPFWSIFHRANLGMLTQPEAEELIETRFRAAGVEIEKSELARLIAIAGRFPFFLQLAGSHLFEEKAGRARQWRRDFEEEAEPYFRHLWNNLREAEQQAMRWMTEIGERMPDDRLVAHLEKRGLVAWDERSFRGYCPFSEAFEGYIKSEPNPHPLVRGVQRLFKWVKGGKVGAGVAEVNFERPKE
jgi:AAA-like domain